MELLVILAVIIFVACLVIRKPRPSVPLHEQLCDPLEELVKPDIIEDTTHLKADLAATKESLSQVQQRLGKVIHENEQLFFELKMTSAAREHLEQDYKKLQSQKKSSEVRTGTFVEILAPIAEQFPVNPKTMRFLGSPIDYISFCYETDTITFIEVKSGQSQLNENQRRVKKMVENGKVEFKVVRLNEDGIKIK